MVQPSRVGKYELLAEIGRGGMATVYRARLRVAGVTDKPVSLKLLHQHLAGERDFLLLFVNEMRVAMGMSHRNIVQTFDAGEEQGNHFMVMELVDGCTLGQLLAQLAAAGRELPVELALFVGMELCAALDYAHSHPTGEGKIGVFHRDVSPSNVLLSNQGDVKLADFGVAKAAGRLTVVGDAIKGKLGYMAPEQGRGKVDARSDIFSLGALLYEALTCRLMRKSPDLDAVIYHRETDLVPPSRYRADLPRVVDELVLSCVARDPEDRPPDARALRDQLAVAAFEVQRVAGAGFDLQMRLQEFLREQLGAPAGDERSSEGQTARVRQAMLDQAREIPTDMGTLSGRAEGEATSPEAGRPLDELPTTARRFGSPAERATIGVDEETTAEQQQTGLVVVAPSEVLALDRRRRWLFGVAALGLLALSVGIIFWIASADQQGAARVERAVASADAAAAVAERHPADEPVARETSRDAAGDVMVFVPEEVSPRRRSKISRRRRPKARSAAKSAIGWLDVNAAPWARVYIDDRYRGDTPLQNIALPAGRHRLRLVNPRLKRTRSLDVEIKPNQRHRQAVRLD